MQAKHVQNRLLGKVIFYSTGESKNVVMKIRGGEGGKQNSKEGTEMDRGKEMEEGTKGKTLVMLTAEEKRFPTRGSPS